MNKLLRKQFLAAIKLRQGNDFQDFVDELLDATHGAKYLALKQKRDKGCDGILNGTTIVAAYGPESYSLKSFKSKTNSDFKSYCKHWQKDHPNWFVVTNCELLANMIQHVNSLQSGSLIKGCAQLLKMIEELPWSKITRLGEYLGIPAELIINDLLVNIVDDLLRMNDSGQAISPRPHAIYIEDKIRLNYDASEVHAATLQYTECLEFFNAMQEILRGHTSAALSALRHRLSNDYLSLGGTFQQRFNGLLSRYHAKAPNDDLYRFGIVVVLTFFFEQCLIGDRTALETIC